MLSRVEMRVALERTLQAGAMLLLAWLAVRPPAPVMDADVVPAASALAGVVQGQRDRVVLHVDTLPGAGHRELLGLARDAGIPVSWTAHPSVAPLAMAVDAVGDPVGTQRVSLWSPVRTILRDTTGELWRASDSGAVGAMEFDLVPGAALRGSLADGRAQAIPAPPVDVAPRRVRVIGSAGWEGRFVAQALGERGWQVETDYSVAGRDVRVTSQGAQVPLDTAIHAAVVLVVDSGAPLPPVAPLVAFVRAGGGLVVAGPATLPILPARAGAALPATLDAPVGSEPRRALRGRALIPGPEAVVVERRDSRVVMAARREGLGRVLQMGYTDSWRWRMEGDDTGPRTHAEWWSSLVASVARSPAGATVTHAAADPAPWAAWQARLGPPGPSTSAPHALEPVADHWLLAVAFAALLTAWGSRRARGLS